MLLPPCLQKGDTIGFFSPSSPATHTFPTRFERAKAFLQAKGFKLIAGNLTGKSDYYRSGSIAQRADELNELIHNRQIKCIMSTIGGNNANALLPYIDYETISKQPKIFIGYSDVTAILHAIYVQTGLVTFYGPALVASFGELPPFVDITYSYFADFLLHKHSFPYILPTPPITTQEMMPWEKQVRSKTPETNKLLTIQNGQAQGRLIAGNLNTMWGFSNSPYSITIVKGDILLIEDSLKDIATTERLFSMLLLNGTLDKIGGIVLGKHEHFDDLSTHRQPADVLMEVLNGRKMPILANFDCSHTHPMLTVPIGVEAQLDATKQTLTLLRNWVC